MIRLNDYLWPYTWESSSNLQEGNLAHRAATPEHFRIIAMDGPMHKIKTERMNEETREKVTLDLKWNDTPILKRV